MKLRKRAAKAVQYIEDVSEDSYSLAEYSSGEELYEPRQNPRHKAAPRGAPRGRNKNKKKPAPSRGKKPELLELALQHLDMRSCLDEKTKKSLRLTSKRVRELVEDARALACFRFSGRGLKTFNEFLESPNSIQRVESIAIKGRMNIAQANKFVLCAPPRLKKLEINDRYDGTEAILCGDFPQLTSFTLDGYTKGESFNLLAQTTWPLQELVLICAQPHLDNLAAILDNYPGLRKLELRYIRYNGVLSEQRFENGLQKLEVLAISGVFCNDYLKHHLFHENLQLPSIHTLIFKSNLDCLQHAVSISCSWMKQLRFLILGCGASDAILPLDTFQALMAILEGGPLESLTVHVLGSSRNSWNFVSLPNLTKIDLNLVFTGIPESIDFFDVVSSPHLPMLKEAKMHAKTDLRHLGYASISSNGVEKLSQAYPHLKSLSLAFQVDVLVAPTVVREIFTHILPHLEEFSLHCCKLKQNYVCTDIFGIGESAGVKWPTLQKLTLNLYSRHQFQDWVGTPDEYPLLVLQQLAAAAHHCPNLRDLRVGGGYNRADVSEIIKNISKILIEGQAWPFMQRFDYNKHPLWLQLLRNLWPNAEFVST